MGDIKKLKKKYKKPRHPWQKDRIETEKPIIQEFGLKNKTEIWKASALLKNFSDQAKKLISATGKQSELEKKQLLNKLTRLGLIKQNSDLDDALSVTLKDILNRRLQTILSKKKISRSLKQSRQLITHQHIKVNNKTITSPSYIVPIDEEAKIAFHENSALSNESHPERILINPKTKEVKTEIKEGQK